MRISRQPSTAQIGKGESSWEQNRQFRGDRQSPSLFRVLPRYSRSSTWPQQRCNRPTRKITKLQSSPSMLCPSRLTTKSDWYTIAYMSDDCMVRVPRHLYEEIRRLAHPATAAAYLRYVIERHVEETRFGACSSTGRALPLHGRGCRFDSVQVHQSLRG